MQKSYKKLHLNIKGNLLNVFFHPTASIKARSLGLKTKEIVHVKEGHMKLVVVGERKNLWKMVHWTKNGPIFASVHEVAFQFVDVEA